MKHFPWRELGIARTMDAGAIRRAYAERLKALDLDSDVVAYAELREARDFALAETRRAASAPADAASNVVELDDYEEFEWSIDTALADGDRYHMGFFDDKPSYPEDAPVAADLADQSAELEARHRTAREAWERLAAALFPSDEPNDEAFTEEEWSAAQAELARLEDSVEALPIQDHGAIEIALADLLARGWPRSAPLVEQAEAHFGWLDHQGTLSEHSAVAFLNARLHGMRFHEAVQLPSHPLHRAWNELTRPRLPRVVSQFTIRRRDVLDLIGTVRGHFPEIEHFFDGPRTAAWEDADGALMATIIRAIIVIYLATTLIGIFNRDGDEPPSSAVPPAVVSTFDAASNAAIAEAWREVFGEAYDPEAARQAAPWFTDLFRATVRSAPRDDRDEDVGTAAALGLTRWSMAYAVDDAGFDDLVALQRVRLWWLRAARSQGGVEACRLVLEGDIRLVELTLPPEQRAAERRLAARLLRTGKLTQPSDRPASRRSVPGWLISDLTKRSGLTPDQVSEALGDTASRYRCDAVVGLLEAMLAHPSKVPAELLRLS